MKYEAVIFDMDGTTLYTLQDLTNCTNMALEKNGLPLRDLSYIRSIVGNGIHREVELAVPQGSSKECIEKVFADFLEIYAEHSNDTTKPYEGILDLLAELKEHGIHTAIVSNKADEAVQVLDEIYFKGLIEIGVGEKADVQRKPAPDSVNAVLKQLGMDRAKAVYVGDSEVDVATGKNAGMDVIGVTWGYREEDALAGATKIVHTVEELKETLLAE